MAEQRGSNERKESQTTAGASAGGTFAVGGAVLGAAVGGAAVGVAIGSALFGSGPAHAEPSQRLQEMNAADQQRMHNLPDPAARTRQRATLLFANSLDMPTVAKLLGESLRGTEERLIQRSLYGFGSDLGLRVPAFQFVEGRVVRNLDRVLLHLRGDLHSLEVVNWFHGENPDLQLNDRQVSPVAWLEAGGDAGVVARLAEGVGRPI